MYGHRSPEEQKNQRLHGKPSVQQLSKQLKRFFFRGLVEAHCRESTQISEMLESGQAALVGEQGARRAQGRDLEPRGLRRCCRVDREQVEERRRAGDAARVREGGLSRFASLLGALPTRRTNLTLEIRVDEKRRQRADSLPESNRQ